MIDEVWKDIVGYDDEYKGLYQISSYGRVRCLDRVDSIGRKRLGHIINGAYSGAGYKYVGLTKNAKTTSARVNRLVALAFIQNKENKPYVNHKDENKKNNNVENLEWVTAKENSNYGTSIERLSKSQSIPIKVIYQDNTYEIWDGASIFAREYGNSVDQRHIVDVLKGRRKTHRGLRFEYVD